MKKRIHRILSAMLAVLFALSTGAAAAAAGTQDTVTITQMPANTSFSLGWGWPDLSGLEVAVTGSYNQTIRYDDIANGNSYGPNKVNWFMNVYPAGDSYEWEPGANKAMLNVFAYQCTQFVVEKTIDGVEYGHYDEELVFGASCEITLTAVDSSLPQGNVIDLTLNTPADVSVKPAGEFSADSYAYFRFTAPEDGYYSFRSQGGQNGDTLCSRDGKILEIPSIWPVGYLMDAQGDLLARSFSDDCDFVIFHTMRKGEAVYLQAGVSSDDTAQYTVTVRASESKLQLNVKEMTMMFHERIDFNALLKGTGLTEDDVYLVYDNDVIDGDCRGTYAAERGTTVLTVYDKNGSPAEVAVHVKYSFEQWMCMIFLGGFVWMDYTLLGPFDLGDNIRALKDYGLRNALYDLMRDWNIPY